MLKSLCSVYLVIFIQVPTKGDSSNGLLEFSQSEANAANQALGCTSGGCQEPRWVGHLPGLSHVTYGWFSQTCQRRSFLEVSYTDSPRNSQCGSRSERLKTSPHGSCSSLGTVGTEAKDGVTLQKRCNKWPVHRSLTLVCDSRPSHIPAKVQAADRLQKPDMSSCGRPGCVESSLTVTKTFGNGVACHNQSCHKVLHSKSELATNLSAGQIGHVSAKSNRRPSWMEIGQTGPSTRAFLSRKKPISDKPTSTPVQNGIPDVQLENGQSCCIHVHLEKVDKSCQTEDLCDNDNKSLPNSENKACQTLKVCFSGDLGKSPKVSSFVLQTRQLVSKACQTPSGFWQQKERSQRSCGSNKTVQPPQLRCTENKTCQTHITFLHNSTY